MAVDGPKTVAYRATMAESREVIEAGHYRLGWQGGQDERFCTLDECRDEGACAGPDP